MILKFRDWQKHFINDFWNKGDKKTPTESLEKHFKKHGIEVGAATKEQYIKKAVGFSKNLKGATTHKVFGFTEGVIRYSKKLNMDMSSLEPFVKNASYKFKKVLDDEEIENAFLKIGGNINWVQGEEHPKCKKCGKTMIFIMEIQSDEGLSNGENVLMFGDVGKLYVFACCDTITTLYQST